jgi:hypothetical protein
MPRTGGRAGIESPALLFVLFTDVRGSEVLRSSRRKMPLQAGPMGPGPPAKDVLRWGIDFLCMHKRTQKRARTREGSGERASLSHALEGAHVEGCSRQRSPKSGDFAAPLTLACGTPRFRGAAPIGAVKRGAVGARQSEGRATR